jgi:hypothetical protein
MALITASSSHLVAQYCLWVAQGLAVEQIVAMPLIEISFWLIHANV